MKKQNSCASEGAMAGFEIVRLPKAEKSCRLCEDYSRQQKTKPVAVLCCEGACLRGEVARQAANILCQSLAPEKTARICLGSAFTKDGGQRNLVRSAPRVIAIEGCHLECASRTMRGVLPELKPEVVLGDRLFDFDRGLFGIEEMAEEDIKAHARMVAGQVAQRL